jgi:hypothetical protein
VSPESSPAETRVRAQLVRGLLPEETFSELKAQMDDLARRYAGRPVLDQRFQRNFLYNIPRHVELHDELTPLAARLAGRPVKKSYVFGALYGDQGVCPVHTDRAQCKYTLDLCVSQREPWALYVDGDAYFLEENDALFYSGTDSPHYRDRIQPGNHCNLIFFHYVDEDFDGPLS